MKTDINRWQWAAAVAVAAFYASYKMPVRALWKSTVAVWRAVRAKPEQTVSDDLFERRMATCRQCSVYYAPLSTCGSPLRKGYRNTGCSCFLPALARLKETHCWIRETTDLTDAGWPDDLMFH